MFPEQKAKVRMIKSPRQAFGATDHIKTFGRVIEASWISSAVERVSSFENLYSVKS